MQKPYLIKTKYGEFRAVIRRDPKEKVYFVSIPAFPGTLTEARTLTEAKKYAAEVITLHALDALEADKFVIDDTRRIYGKHIRPGVAAFA